MIKERSKTSFLCMVAGNFEVIIRVLMLINMHLHTLCVWLASAPPLQRAFTMSRCLRLVAIIRGENPSCKSDKLLYCFPYTVHSMERILEQDSGARFV